MKLRWTMADTASFLYGTSCTLAGYCFARNWLWWSLAFFFFPALFVLAGVLVERREVA